MAEEEKAPSKPAPSEVSRMEPAPSAVVSKSAQKPNKPVMGGLTQIKSQTKPVMGGLTQTDTDKWTAWTGGKPKADWSGFVDKNLMGFETQQREQIEGLEAIECN